MVTNSLDEHGVDVNDSLFAPQPRLAVFRNEAPRAGAALCRRSPAVRREVGDRPPADDLSSIRPPSLWGRQPGCQRASTFSEGVLRERSTPALDHGRGDGCGPVPLPPLPCKGAVPPHRVRGSPLVCARTGVLSASAARSGASRPSRRPWLTDGHLRQPLLKPGAFSSGGWRRIPRGCGERRPRLVNRVRGRGSGAHGAACPRYASFPGCGQRPSVGEPVCGSGGAPGSEVEGYRRIRGAGAAVLEVRIGDGTLKRLPSAATRRTPVTSFRRAVSAERGAPWPVAAGRRRDACRMAGRLAEAT